MITKSALCIPFGLMMLVATSGCGGAPTDSEGAPGGQEPATPAADHSGQQAATPTEQASPGAPNEDNVGKAQQQWLGVPGYGLGVPGYGLGVPGYGLGVPGYGYGYVAPNYGYGVGYPYYGYGGYGLGTGWGWSTATTCVNGFCTGY